MIAAVVLLALVASSQVQAFPGSDPVAEVMATLPEHPLLRSGPNVVCIVGYIQKIQKVISEATTDMSLSTAAMKELTSRCSKCMKADTDKVICVAQAIRDTWQDNEQLREKVYKVVSEAIELAKEVKQKCFD